MWLTDARLAFAGGRGRGVASNMVIVIGLSLMVACGLNAQFKEIYKL